MLLLLTTAAAVVGGLVAFLPPSAAEPTAEPAAAAAAVPKLDWRACTGKGQSGFKCATARVPLDYDEPGGKTIELAVIKHKAPDPRERIGKLFFNPGGPGGAGTEDLPAFFDLFPKQARERFDIISWDPRGVGASTAVQCFANQKAENDFLGKLPDGYPVGRAEQDKWISTYERFGQLCGQRNGDLLEHVSTLESAKDLDLLRRAVGSEKMNYMGTSYGTLLGATYANVYPNRVRAMILDGNVDPLAWANRNEGRPFLSTSLRLGSDVASAKTLGAYLSLCGRVSKDQCAFSAGTAVATRAKWETLVQRLSRRPVMLDGVAFDQGTLAGYISGPLFTVEPRPGGFRGWTASAVVLQDLWKASSQPASGAAATPAAQSYAGAGDPSAAGAEQKYSGTEQELAVQCSDSPSPQDPDAYRRLGALAFERAGILGPNTSWGDEPCASWPARAEDRYAGPWDKPTANPLLVVGNTLDPATSYNGSVAMANALDRARLLTVDGYGHTVLLNPSACAKTYENRYLVDGELPPPGTVCQQDTRPFAKGAGS